MSGQAAGAAACAQLGAEQCERSAQVRGCPAVCAAIVTQLDTQSRPEAVMLAQCTRLWRPPSPCLGEAAETITPVTNMQMPR